MKFKKFITESVETPSRSTEDVTDCQKTEEFDDEQCIVKNSSDYHVKKYGAWWFGIVGPDGLLLKDEEGNLRLFKSKDAAKEFIETNCNVLVEELTNLEKLKRAYPELNFDEPITEAANSEGMTNMQKLVAAYPELEEDIDADTVINEGVGADLLNKFRELLMSMSARGKSNHPKLLDTVTKVVDVVPDSLVDDVFDLMQKKLSNVHVDEGTEETIAAAGGISKEEKPKTLDRILDAVEMQKELIEENPELTKTFITTTLKAVGAVEPTPVVEIITAIVSMLPAKFVAKLITLIQSTNPAFMVASKIRDSRNATKVKSAEAAPVTEDIEDDFDYDDDYDIDDVEQDHVHAALYGGDLTYCKHCGDRLKRHEWGSYCPTCDPDEDLVD